MKISKLLMAVGLLAALGFSGVASAHQYSGTLGVAAAATDRWYIVCTAPSVGYMEYRIQRTSRAAGTNAHVKIVFDSTGIASGPTTGAKAVTAFSPQKTGATPRAGAKFFTIKKTAAGAVSYRVSAYCLDKNGLEVSPDELSSSQIYIQNQ
jgi:hypothetical protein